MLLISYLCCSVNMTNHSVECNIKGYYVWGSYKCVFQQLNYSIHSQKQLTCSFRNFNISRRVIAKYDEKKMFFLCLCL